MIEVEDDAKQYRFLSDRIMLNVLRDPELTDYLITLFSAVLKEKTSIIGDEFEIINPRVGSGLDTKNSESDVIIKSKYGYFDIEVNTHNSMRVDNKNVSYMCNLVLKQLPIGTTKYEDLRIVILFNISSYDQFKAKKFIYESALLEKHSFEERTGLFKIVDVNMDFLSKLNYNDIKKLSYRSPERLLYIFTGIDKTIRDELYGDDEMMKKVESKMEEYSRILDEIVAYDYEECREMNIKDAAREAGISEGLEQGVKQNRLDNAKAFLESGVKKKVIIDTLNLKDYEIQQLGW